MRSSISVIMPLRFLLPCALFAGCGLTAVFSQTTVDLREGVNGYAHVAALIRGDNPALNSGVRDQLLVGKTAGAGLRVVFSFNLSSIPAGASISGVSLDLWTDPASSTASGTVGALELHKLNVTPVEGTGNGGGGGGGTGVTWTSRDGQSGTGHSWTTAGGDFDAAVLASVPGFLTTTPNVQKTFAASSAFISAVQAAVSNGQPLNLLVYAPTTEAGTAAYTRLCSDDSTTTGQRPRLTVTFAGYVQPSNLLASAVSATRVTLAWSDQAATETGFVIERQTGASGAWTTVATTAANVTSFTDTGLQPETGYTYRIKALYPGNESAYVQSSLVTTDSDIATPVLVVMPIGDSITQGTGAAGGYRSPLCTLLLNAGYSFRFAGSHAINAAAELTDSGNDFHEGHGGYAIKTISDNIDGGTSNGGHWLDGIPGTRDPVYPDVILLMIGTNDLGSGNREVAPTLADYNALLTKFATMRPHALIIASSLVAYTGTDPAIYPLREQHQQEFNAALPALVAAQQAAGHRVAFYDMRTKVNLVSHISSTDFVHPTASGYVAMASGWMEAFQALPLMANWRRTYFGTAIASRASASLADDDGDGATNLQEFALGGDPTQAASSVTPQPGTYVDGAGNRYLTVSFPRRRIADLDYQVQVSADLSNPSGWSGAVAPVGAPVAIDADFEQVTYRDSEPLASGARRFMRVQVTAP